MEDKLVLTVDLATEEVEILPLSYPEEMKEDMGWYGSLSFPSFTIAEDRWVYIYDKATGKVQMLDMKSDATPDQASRSDERKGEHNFVKNIDFESQTLRFCNTYYDRTADVYVRMHHAGREDFEDKRKSYLVVYRCRTGETLEYELPEELSAKYFVSDGRLYIELKNHDDVCLRFAVVDLQEL